MAPKPSFDELRKAKQAELRAAGPGSEGVHGRAAQPKASHGVGGGVVSARPTHGVGGGVISKKKPDMAVSMKRMLRRK